MQAKELVVGAKYILKQIGNPVAVFEGRHEGVVLLSDGARFFGAKGALRFRYTDETGAERVVLLDTAAAVEEPEATKVERERIFAERVAREAAARSEAVAFMEALGFGVVENAWEARKESNVVALRLTYANATGDGIGKDIDFEIEELNVGPLRAALAKLK